MENGAVRRSHGTGIAEIREAAGINTARLHQMDSVIFHGQSAVTSITVPLRGYWDIVGKWGGSGKPNPRSCGENRKWQIRAVATIYIHRLPRWGPEGFRRGGLVSFVNASLDGICMLSVNLGRLRRGTSKRAGRGQKCGTEGGLWNL